MELLLLYRVLKRRLLLFSVVFGVFMGTTIIGTELLTRQYRSQSTVMISQSGSISTMLTNLGITGIDWYAGKTVFEGVDVAFATSRSLVEHVIQTSDLKGSDAEYLDYEDLTESKIGAFVKGRPFLEADLDSDSDRILLISAYADTPEKAREICRSATNTFVSGRLERIKQEFSGAKDYLTATVDQAKQRYLLAAAQLRDYQQVNATVNLELETELILSKMRDVNTALEENIYQIEQRTGEIAIASDILLKLDLFREDSRSLAETDQRKELKTLYNELAVELERLGVEHAADHPFVLEALAKIRKVRELIKQEPDSAVQMIRQAINPLYDVLSEKIAANEVEIRGLRAREQPLQQTLSQYRGELEIIPEKSMKLDLLQRSLNVETDTYQGLLKAQVQMEVAESMVLSNMLIVNEPYLPTERDFPSRKLNWILGFFLALAMALMAALTWEYVARAKEEMDQAEMGQAERESMRSGDSI